MFCFAWESQFTFHIENVNWNWKLHWKYYDEIEIILVSISIIDILYRPYADENNSTANCIFFVQNFDDEVCVQNLEIDNFFLFSLKRWNMWFIFSVLSRHIGWAFFVMHALRPEKLWKIEIWLPWQSLGHFYLKFNDASSVVLTFLVFEIFPK